MVVDLVRNILRFNPDALVVLHVSRLFTDFDPASVAHLANVIINPKRYLTKHGKGLMLCHCSNFRWAICSGHDFDFFCLMSSNEMFIRPGLAGYIAEMRNGFQAVAFDLREGWHIFSRRIDEHPKVVELRQRLGGAPFYGGQTEGQFYEKELFAHISELYLRVFGEIAIGDFETEEVVPQTIAMAAGARPAPPFTLVDYSHPLDFKLSQRVVALLANARFAGRVRLNLGETGTYFLRSPHLNETNRSVFSVKRVPREENDPLRAFINHLPDASGLPRRAEGPIIPLKSGVNWSWVMRTLRRTARRFVVSSLETIGLAEPLRKMKRILFRG